MRNLQSAARAALSMAAVSSMFAASLKLPDTTVGRNLQSIANVTLSEPRKGGDMVITLTSSDPSKLLLSAANDTAGSPSLEVTVREGSAASSNFYLQALAGEGTVSYAATAAGVAKSMGKVTLARSGLTIASPFGTGKPLLTSAGTISSRLTLNSVPLTASGQPGDEQQVRGGLVVTISLSASKPGVGSINPSTVTIQGGLSSTTAEFEPTGPGETLVGATAVPAFDSPSQFGNLTAKVRGDSMMVSSTMVGENLQSSANVLLSRPAPAGGLKVTITSSDPRRLLLSNLGAGPGAKSTTITVPAGVNSASFTVEGMARSGSATYTATAPGFQDATGTATLTPSGVLLGVIGPPDEGDLSDKESGDRIKGFVTSLSRRTPSPVMVYTVQLDPVNLRAADVTVQPLRNGLSLTVNLKMDNPAVGKITSPVTIKSGAHEVSVDFTPLSAGTSLITLETPEGFTKAGNGTQLKAIVQN
jgi:hypothetical protein